MKERIEAIIQHERLSPSQLADAIGVQRSGISHILSGRNKPSVDFLNKLLSKFPHVSGDWLITGNGRMFKNDFKAKQPPKQLDFTVEEETVRKPLKVPSMSLKEEPYSAYKTSKSAIAGDKAIERIVVFYKDKTFAEYKPE